MIRTANEPRTCLAKGIIVAVALFLSASTPKAETTSTNKIHNIEVKAQKGKTVVSISGSKRPSFTAFKLSSPKRLVIDLADSHVRGIPSIMESMTDIIDGIAVSQYSVKGVPVSRVMINFKKDAAYRVRVKGNKLVASLSGSPGVKSSSKESQESDNAGVVTLEELEQLKAESSRHKADATRAKQAAKKALSSLKEVETRAKKAEEAARIAESKLRSISEKAEEAKREAEKAETDLMAYKKRAEEAQDRVKHVETDYRSTRSEIEQAKQEAKKADLALARVRKEAEKSKKAEQDARSEMKALRAEANEAKAAVEAAYKTLAMLKEENERSKREAATAKASLKASRKAAERAEKEAAKAEKNLLKYKSEAAEAKRQASEVAMLKEENERSKREAATAKASLKASRKAAERAEKEAAKAEKNLLKYKSEAAEAKRQASEVRSNLTSLKKESKAAKVAAKKAKAQLAELQRQLKQVRQNADHAVSAKESKHRADLKAYQRELDKAALEIEQYQEKATSAARTAAQEKANREKLERGLAVLTAERDDALSEKERSAKAKRDAEVALAKLRQQMEGYKSAAQDAEDEAKQALKAQVEASRAYQKAAESEKAELLSVLRQRERETVRAKTRAAELKDDYQQAKRSLGKSEKKLRATVMRAEQDVAAERRARSDLEQKLKQANRRFEEANREAALAKKRADQARAAQEDAQSAIARIQEKADAFKTRAEEEAQQKVRAAEEKLTTAKKRASLAEENLNAAETELADLKQSAEAADARAKSLEAELASAKQTITAQEKTIEQLKVAEKNQKRKLTQEEMRLARLEKMRGESAAKKPVRKQSRAPTETAAAPFIKNIEFVDDENTQKVLVHTTSPLEYAMTTNDNGGTRITFKNTKLAAMLERTLDVTDFGGIIGSVTSFQDGADVKIEVKVDKLAQNTVERRNNTLEFTFSRKRGEAKEGNSEPLGSSSRTVAREDASTYDYPFERTAAYSSGSSGKKKRYTGRHIDLDFKDADIHNILRLLSDVGHVNIITADNVTGSVTIRMRDVAWDHALDIILQAKSLGMVREGNLIRVAPLAQLEKEREMEIARRQQAIALEPLETRLIPISYATASELMPRAQDLLSERGKLSTDARTNVIIARDTKDVLDQIEALIRNLDTQTPQVLIESRIVEATSMYAREIGIQWGGDFSASSATGNPTGLIFPNTIGLAGGATDSQTPTAGLTPVANGQPNPNFGVNMPAPVGTNSGGALGITLGSISNNSNLSLRLSAMEETGTLRILSSPKILTLDNREAHIEQGTMIPFSQVSAQGVQTSFKEAKLNLTVKPHVTADGSVLLTMTVMRDEPDFNNTGARGDPTILKRQAKTELLVSDGHTAVIGGIFTRNAGTSFKKVPFFADIPIIGWLFKKKSDSDRRSEMLIFITPRIVNRAESIGS